MLKRHSLLTFIRYQYEIRVSYELQIYILKSLRDVLFLALEFFIENTMVQVISTVDHNRTPLRDLGCEFLVMINAKKFAYLGFQLYVENLAFVSVLFCLLNGSKGFTVVNKGVRCLAIGRLLRMCIFSMTILPSPKSWCRFTGPINPFRAHVGGACNDLLYSGHVVLYTIIATAFTKVSQEYSLRIFRYGLPILIWCHLTQRAIRTILEHHHYSIDMFLGCIVTLLIWQCKPLHIDLPIVPQNSFLHLKHLFFPRIRSILKEV